MKKTIAAVLAAVSISLAAGCAANLPAGYDKFTAAREKYETLSSGRVTMTDLTTGDEIMRFSFYFNVNDEMVFSYWGSWQGEEQQAYSDGAEFFYKESGDEKWTVISSDDDGYIYNVYNRGYRYPYAEGRLFFLAGEAVRNAGIIESGDGPTSITYTYDPEKLNSASMPGVQEDIQSFERLTTTLEIDQQGYPSSFTEDGSVVTAAGEVQDPEVAVHFGNLIAVVLDFLIIAFVIFCMIKVINKFHRKAEEPAPEPAPPEPSAEEKLLTEIRDLLKEAHDAQGTT